MKRKSLFLEGTVSFSVLAMKEGTKMLMSYEWEDNAIVESLLLSMLLSRILSMTFSRVLSMFSWVLSLMFSPSHLNVFPSHCLVSLMSWGWPLSNAICMLENTTNAIRLKDNISYHGIIIKADGAFIFKTSWLSKQESVAFFTPLLNSKCHTIAVGFWLDINLKLVN